MQLLRIAAAVECASLLILLVNLFTVHAEVITSLGGPTHGLAYLFIVVATLRNPMADKQAKALAFVPGVGGLLVLRRLTATAVA